MKRFICGLFATIGLLCVLFSGPITTVLPYILVYSKLSCEQLRNMV